MSEVSNAIRQIASEKGLTYESVLATIEAALAAAYRKDFGSKLQNIKVDYDPDTGALNAFDVKTVVEDLPEDAIVEEIPAEEGFTKRRREVEQVRTELEPKAGESEEEVRRFNPKNEMQMKDAVLIKKDAEIGDEIRMQLEVPGEFGRMAAQTAKQVIIQKLREAERDLVYGEWQNKQGEVIGGVVQRREGRVVLIDLGKAIGILPPEEQVATERYNPGNRLKLYVKSVGQSAKGPEIILSRVSDEIIKKVFYLEIPEISNGLIELKAIAREAGSRSKVAVATEHDNVDPIGSCVGQRGARIQTIIAELGGEKVDIIEYHSEPEKFVASALSPAKVVSIKVDERDHKATVMVAADQFSLAIGKNGQNVRLAARLTGWKIDIYENKESGTKISSEEAGETEETQETEDRPSDSEEAKETQEAEDHPSDSKDAKEMEETQETQEAEESQEMKEAEEAEEAIKTEEAPGDKKEIKKKKAVKKEKTEKLKKKKVE
jgi:transcription termination/antitermination protein NusA